MKRSWQVTETRSIIVALIRITVTSSDAEMLSDRFPTIGIAELAKGGQLAHHTESFVLGHLHL